MDNIQNTEWMLLMVLILHLIMAPGTKVEESFNVQAVHDILYHRFNLSAYDHNEFPGVVPRTFIGPLAISFFILPFVDVCRWFGVTKLWILLGARLVLGMFVLLGFCNFCRCVQKHFGRNTATFLRIITASQFHFLFYASRPLPNIFALVGVLWTYQLWLDGKLGRAVWVATIFTALFRCELVLLFGCIFIVPLIKRKLPLFGFNGALANGFMVVLITLAVSVPVDSVMWQRFLWPEGEVWWFNVVQNRSSEYGVYPFLWYIYSALPRALLTTYFLVPFGLVCEKRLLFYVLPALFYIFIYSFLPHKELRFIIYTFPLLNLAAASFCAKLYVTLNTQLDIFVLLILQMKSTSHLVFNIAGTSVLSYASSWNYPGSQAIGYLQFMQRYDRNKLVTVHIDNYAAQTGVSRFLQFYDTWQYNKTEHLGPSDLKNFDFLLVGSYNEKNIVSVARRNYSSSHRLLFSVKAFQ
uniref:Mannosyltransferase n=1 Tax=Syphacia muris TaxID=451379 RepID=A0A0N5AU12_9BILA